MVINQSGATVTINASAITISVRREPGRDARPSAGADQADRAGLRLERPGRRHARLPNPVELDGYGGNETLLAGSGNDLLVAGPGANSLVGGAGDDTLVSNGGDDTLVGGTGNAVFQINPGQTHS